MKKVLIALVLLLIYGVNQVFKIASGAVGAGQALSTAQRDNRSAQAVIYSDFRSMVTTGAPFFIIKSERVSAFRNNEDRLSDRDYPAATTLDAIDLAVRTVDNDANNSEADPVDVTEGFLAAIAAHPDADRIYARTTAARARAEARAAALRARAGLRDLLGAAAAGCIVLLAAAALWSAPARACADFKTAPSSRWTIGSSDTGPVLLTPCGERFFSLGVEMSSMIVGLSVA